MRSGIQSQTSQVERQSQCTEHQVGASCGIGYHVHSRPERTNQDTYDNRSAGKSQLHRSTDARQGNGNRTQSQPQDDTDKHRYQIRFFQALDGISQHFFHILDGGSLTYHCQTVAQLQSQFRGGKQLHAATVHTADVDAVMIAQVQRAQFLSVQFGTCHHDTLRDELAVYGIPVYILFVPVGMFLFTEQYGQCRSILFRSHHQQAVSFPDYLLGSGDAYVAVPPQTGDYELRIIQAAYLLDAFIEDGRIVYLKRRNVSFVRIVLLFQLQIFLTRQCLAYYQHGKNNAHYPQRICHGTSQSRRTGFQPHLLQCLLCRTQRRRIGGSAAEDAHHVRQRNIQGITAQYGHQRTEEHYSQRQHIQLYPALAERAEKARPHLQSQCIHKNYQSETFRIVQHLRVDGQSEMSGKNTGKENKRHAEGNTANMYFPQP